MTAPFDPIAIIRVLADHDVECILIGGLAAVLHGSPATTNDADIVPEPSSENLGRLAAMLRSVDARLRVDDEPDGVAFDPHPALLGSISVLDLTTRLGDLDLALRPAGLGDFDELAAAAVEFDVEGVIIRVASLDDVIRSKEAAGRAKDRATLPTLYALRDEIGRQSRD